MRGIEIGGRFFTTLLRSLMLMLCLLVNSWAIQDVSTDRTTYYPGENIRVHFSGAPGKSSDWLSRVMRHSRDWICIVPSEKPDNFAGDYQYLPTGKTQGYLNFRAPDPGEYEVRAYYNYRQKSYTVSARSRFTVLPSRDSAVKGHRKSSAEHGLLLSTDKKSYLPGKKIHVRFSGAPGYSSDWISIVPAGSADSNAGTFQYLPNGMSTGDLTFIAPKPGRYEARAYYNYRKNGYLVTARYTFTVRDKIFRQEDIPPKEKKSTPSEAIVKKAQYALTERGYIVGGVDGIYGRKTRSAIKQFQNDNKLEQSGNLSKETIRALGLKREVSEDQTDYPFITIKSESIIPSKQFKAGDKVTAKLVYSVHSGQKTTQLVSENKSVWHNGALMKILDDREEIRESGTYESNISFNLPEHLEKGAYEIRQNISINNISVDSVLHFIVN